MTVIDIKNGTKSITIECAQLTVLIFNTDNQHYVCQYGSWAYGLFAIVIVVGFFLPMAYCIYCCARCQNHKKGEPRSGYRTLENSYSSAYPYTTEATLHTVPYDEHSYPQSNHNRLPERNNKSYYPYPAYGTNDCQSLGNDSIDSLNRDNVVSKTFLSNSVPIIDSTLQNMRDNFSKNNFFVDHSSNRSVNLLCDIENEDVSLNYAQCQPYERSSSSDNDFHQSENRPKLKPRRKRKRANKSLSINEIKEKVANTCKRTNKNIEKNKVSDENTGEAKKYNSIENEATKETLTAGNDIQKIKLDCGSNESIDKSVLHAKQNNETP